MVGTAAAASTPRPYIATRRVVDPASKLMAPLVIALLLLVSPLSIVTAATSGSTVRDNCYNGPAPVIVNQDADVFLGMHDFIYVRSLSLREWDPKSDTIFLFEKSFVAAKIIAF